MGIEAGSVADWVSAFANLGLAAGAAGVFFQWRYDQKWKRKDAVFGYIDSFQDTPSARNAIMMLDSHNRPIPLWDRSVREEC